MGKGRSSKIIVTSEGRTLRDLRIKQGLSMRLAGEKLGYSDSYVSQIENGRADPPKGEVLERFLKLYGGISAKYFGELARNWTHEKTDADVIVELTPKLAPRDQRILRTLAEQMARDTGK